MTFSRFVEMVNHDKTEFCYQSSLITKLSFISKMTEQKHNPKFLLRGVDMSNILQKYQSGIYVDFDVNKLSKVTMSHIPIEFDNNGTSPDDQTYFYTDRSNQRQSIITTNHQNFTVYKKTSKYVEKYYCMWCRQSSVCHYVGIPIKMEWDPKTKRSIFYVEHNYCSFDCCFAHLKINSLRLMYQDCIYMDSESMLRILFHLINPGKELKAAPDWTLLQNNGGPLSVEQFNSDKVVYQHLPNIIIIPGKSEYYVEIIK